MHTATAAAFTAAQTAVKASGTGAGIALLDADGRVVGWTQAAERLVGYAPADVVGRSAATLLADGTDRANVSAFFKQGTPPDRWSGIAKVRHRDGHTIEVQLCLQSMCGHDGRAGVVVSATERAALSPMGNEASLTSLPTALHLPARLPVGVTIRDTRLRCAWANDTQGSKDGIPLKQRLGRRLTEAAPGSETEALEALMRQVLESGVPAVNVEYRAFMPTPMRRAGTLTASIFRLDDGQGHALGVCTVSVDVSDSQRARERLAVVGEASKRVGTSLDVMRTGQELADLAVPLLADYATVDLTESVTRGKEPPTCAGPPSGPIPRFLRAGVASINHGAPEALSARGEPVFIPPTSPSAGVLCSGQSHFEPLLDNVPGSTRPDPHDDAAWEHEVRAHMRAHTMHSLMVVPIHARGAALGVATFVRMADSVPFEEDDLLLAEELVSRAALSLDNARQYARERSAALALQRHLLPHRTTGGSAADVAWSYLPADSHHGVGGDWFDVIPLSGARIGLVVGDVVGHGINAAATMGQLRTAVRTLADMDLPPDQLLARLDEQVIRLAEEDADPQDPEPAIVGATCVYAVYDPITRQCTLARAGHPSPAIINPQGGVTFLDLPTGAPLGLGLVPFESVTLELPEHSVLALYTDGLVEDRDHDIDVGMDRLSTALARAGLPLEDLCSTVVDTLPAKTHSDDVTLLLARTRTLGPGQTVSWQLPADPAVVSHARSLATRQLTQWGLEHLTDSTELIVSELVTNAVRHTTSPIGLRLTRHDALTCEVSDTNNSYPRLRHPGITDENGRGLFLVDQLSHRWGTRHTPDGKLIWTEQHLTPRR
ncbi:SpoIIE family protein phosphatase [Streptomyces sp. NPDC054813]